ncbi:endospore germination permease [Paenibacillus sp. CGMCC 1.16610]|uniref:Endospore germination permease n=1 Tax=Paenibacillus anseongense TaxID=2682845 RepID=A0ABW9UBA1_9BACL|nr:MULTISPECIES: endospore germination permease [Paenibacillus]MBA2937232.1 endospore germination permease [Paenibacillus sp. CGMCC 1.16610]MVQ36291.1 endospore germination permease [Paenibacillus anseongense]
MNNKITPVQVFMFFSQVSYSTTIGIFVRQIIKQAQFSAWIAIILGGFVGLVISYCSYLLCIRRPTLFFGQYGKDIMGKWIHYPLFTTVILANLICGALVLRYLSDFIGEIYLPGTPNWIISILFTFCSVRAVRSGAITLFRSAQGLFFFSITAIFILPIIPIKDLNFDMAVAFIHTFNMPGSWNGAMIMGSLIGEMGYIVYFYPYLVQPSNLMKSFSWATITVVFITLTDVISTILLFGPELTENLSSPTLEVIRYTRLGSFLENLDPLLLVFWIYSMFLKVSLFLYVAVSSVTHTFGLKDHKPFTYATATFMVGIALFGFQSTTDIVDIMNYGAAALLLFLDVTPTLYLMVDLFRSLFNKKDTSAHSLPDQ